MKKNTKNPIIGYILTGGKNCRMNGKIKLFLEYEGISFAERICGALSDLDRIVLSVNDPAVYQNLGLYMVEDAFGHIGPMGGILSGLDCLKTDLFVTTSDMPFLTREAVGKITEAYRKKPMLTLACAQGRIQPLLGIYPQSVSEVMRELVLNRQYKMKLILEQVDCQTVELQDPGQAVNINTPEDYRKFCKGENK